ncbi:MAG TPA: hypothetical protein VLA46_10805, partial [Saprospiraceae bacterium]|nr:hypothetical protein [Saprospiraceae bacterium]
MKKPAFLLATIFVILLFPNAGIRAQSNVGIGTTNPSFLLDVQSDPTSTALTNFLSKVNYSGMVSIKAIEGISIPASGYGIGAALSGGLKGVDAYGVGGSNTGSVYGVYGNASGTAGARFGVYGT